MVGLSQFLSRLTRKLGRTVHLRGVVVSTTRDSIDLYYHSSRDSSVFYRVATSHNGLDFTFSQKINQSSLPPRRSHEYQSLILPRPTEFDHGPITIEGQVELYPRTLVVYHSHDHSNIYRVGLCLFDRQKNLLWRTTVPLWESPTSWTDSEVAFIGLGHINYQLIGYWSVDNTFRAVVYPQFKLRHPDTTANLHLINLHKVAENPILKPKAENAWEAFNTFNPAAIYEGGRVHILYRAQGFDYVSVVGYATSDDGIHITSRLDQPIYIPRESFEWRQTQKPSPQGSGYVSGGGYGGIEDPRVTKINDRIYMTYVAFDGLSPPRIAMTSISIDDFLNRRWLWEKPVLISPPNVVDKSCVIFPEKINGKYVIMHRIYPNILIDFVDDLNFDGSTWLKGRYRIKPRPDMWDSRKIGAGAPPIKTKDGWLLIYQSVDDRNDHQYLVGAMLLDLKDPTKVLYRSKLPILRPLEKYENEGFKAGVVYPCGAVVIGETLFVYYGGADSYVCVATANLNNFLNQLEYTETPILEPSYIREIK